MFRIAHEAKRLPCPACRALEHPIHSRLERRWQHLNLVQYKALPEARVTTAPAEKKDDLARFLTTLSSAWRAGEVRPTHQTNPKPARYWRMRKDPFADEWATICGWLAADPDQTGKQLLARLQDDYPALSAMRSYAHSSGGCTHGASKWQPDLYSAGSTKARPAPHSITPK